MITNRPVAGCSRLAGGAVLCLLLISALATPLARGDKPGFYSAGKFHPVVVSETEFAVEFTPQGRDTLEQRMRTTGTGALEPIPWSPGNSRFAILRLPSGDAARRMRIRETAGVRSIHRVYRLRPSGAPILSSGNIVVRFRSDVSATEMEQMLEDYRVRMIEPVQGLKQTYIVAPTGDVQDVELDTANALYRDDRTLYAHPDLRLPIDLKQVVIELGPDPFFVQQWHLENTGQGGGVVGEDINITGAWLRSGGATILIGQLDDACDVEHEDLVDNYIGISQDIADNAQSTLAANPVDAGDRHGTATMGIMVASLNNNVGIAGVAPLATFTASRGLLAAASTSQLASAFNFARNANVDVHNNSWGFEPGTPIPDVMANAIETAFTEGRGGLGMVICFASGNGSGMGENDPVGVEVATGEDVATLSTVIGVGACTAEGKLAAYSNYGADIDVLAPSNDPSVPGLPAIVTTDNRDAEFSESEPGYNNGGVDDDGNPNLADPNYTDNFGGTSAAAPMVSGVAALILALEPNYNATMVRTIIEHTCDKIDATAAAYNGITGRSLRYGYGRINAGTAVEATFDGFFWPERVADVVVEDNVIHWMINDDLRPFGNDTVGVVTETVLVVESDTAFDWAPTDSQAYTVGTMPAPGVTVVANLLAEQYNFGTLSTTKYFGIYPVTTTRRRGWTYGFGVSVTSDGAVIDSGSTHGGGGTGGEDDGELPPGSNKPRVTIEVSQLSGMSPLDVTFKGNVQSAIEIASDGFYWDFGDGVGSTERDTTHTYTVASGTRRFFPRLTVTDIEGNVGERSVAIDVIAPDTGSGGEDGGSTSASAFVSVRISDPNSSATDITSGEVPLEVVLTAELSGSLAPGDVTIFWDLGDGNIADSLSVAHTYRVAGTFPITVTITTTGSEETLKSSPRFLEVLAAAESTPSPTPTSDLTDDSGTSAAPVCGAGSVMALWVMGLFVTLRRRLR